MPQVHYTVDFIDGVWKVGLNGKHFGPYSTMDAAVVAAGGAAHKAEVQGYEAFVTINSLPQDLAQTSGEERDRHAA